MGRQNIIAVLIAALSLVSLSGCSSYSREISRMNKNLEKMPCWMTEYEYSFEDVTLRVVDIMKFKNGNYQCVQKFLNDDNSVLFEVKSAGKYNIIYDSELSSIFYTQEDNDFSINNLSTKEQWFKKFELEYRLNFRGDAYDNVEPGDDDKTIYGEEVIECTSDRFIIKDLENNEVYDYTPCSSIIENMNFRLN